MGSTRSMSTGATRATTSERGFAPPQAVLRSDHMAIPSFGADKSDKLHGADAESQGHEVAALVLASVRQAATGRRMRRVVATLALALGVLGCHAPAGAQGEPVTLTTVKTETPCCLLTYQVVDVVADPTFGTAI